MPRVKLPLLILIGFAFLISCGGPDMPQEVQLAYEQLPKEIDFNQHVKPILSDKCFLCHGPDKNKISAGLQLHPKRFGIQGIGEQSR